MATESIRLDTLLGQVGQSLLDAQGEIDTRLAGRAPGPTGLRTGVVISETEIEVKLLFEPDGGTVAVRPVSSAAARLAEVNPGTLSSLRARIVAVPQESTAAAQRRPADIRTEVLQRPDIARLGKIVGDLQVEPTYISGLQRWVVDIRTVDGQVVRSIQLPDAEPGPAAATKTGNGKKPRPAK